MKPNHCSSTINKNNKGAINGFREKQSFVINYIYPSLFFKFFLNLFFTYIKQTLNLYIFNTIKKM